MISSVIDRWYPSATRERLAQRAALLAAVREFFEMRSVLEVETPILVNAAVTDVNLRPVELALGNRRLFLQTSPEYAMKRLLAAGVGDVYQLCKVVRGDERSRLHNPEFTMLEWYRVGLDMSGLIQEVVALLDALVTRMGGEPRPLRQVSYREAFQVRLQVDPLDASTETLVETAVAHGLPQSSADGLGRDGLLDFLMATVIGPALGVSEWLALTHYPATQAALAQLDPSDPRVVLRFEIYAGGIELANGFQELADANEQRARFMADNAARLARGLPQMPIDELLLAALEAGLPACSGVALGFDRAIMIAGGAKRIDEVVSFTIENA
ncbi:MAG: EF-P lysine aminoacylase GenX [Gammaproteobacteria bacterium]|nr:EF-P lysine aminoacylase GenX [Gammaproteobacteria bacterium]